MKKATGQQLILEPSPAEEAPVIGRFVPLGTIIPRWHAAEPPHYNIDDGSYLCYVCRHVNFRYLVLEHNFPDGLHTGTESILLGTFRDILQRSHCAFCRLVYKAFACIEDGTHTPGILDSDGNDSMCELRLESRLNFGILPPKPNLLKLTLSKLVPDGRGYREPVCPWSELQLITVGISGSDRELQQTGGRKILQRQMNFNLIKDWLSWCDSLDIAYLGNTHHHLCFRNSPKSGQ